MRKSRFTQEQIIGMIKEQEAGLPTAEVCRKHGLSPATFYKLKARYGGLEVSDARRLRQLEDENGKLKRLLAESVVDNAILKDLLGKSDDARPATGRGARRDAGLPGLAAPCLRVDRRRLENGPARTSARPSRDPRGGARDRLPPPPLWLPARRRHAGAQGAHHEPQALPAVP